MVDDVSSSTVRVLVLGDGDCTFSASLTTALQKSSSALESSTTCSYQLVVTCFDSKEDVLHKYPFSIKAIQLLEALPPVSSITEIVKGRLVFGVNATASLESLMQSNEEDDPTHQETFQHIIFNFPHIGKEDCHLHAALLKHILYRAKDVLQSDGCVYISLADGQAVSWQLFKAATDQGLQVVKEIPFNQKLWPGYETRRHQSGKSFNSRVESNVCYLLKRQNSSYEECKDIFTFAMKSHKLSPLNSNSSDNERAKELNHALDVKRKSSAENIKKDKKRRIVQDTQHLIEVISESPCVFKCKQCQKNFNVLRSIQTHIYQMHVLIDAKDNVDDDNLGPRKYHCDECNGREFSNEEALRQHQLSKHVSPKQYTGSLEIKSIYEGNFNCSICGMGFNTEQECDAHMANGITPLSLNDAANMELKCEICQKRFRDQRGLNQHSMFCKSLRKERIVSVGSSPQMQTEGST